jgi:hypothetical protein
LAQELAQELAKESSAQPVASARQGLAPLPEVRAGPCGRAAPLWAAAAHVATAQQPGAAASDAALQQAAVEAVRDAGAEPLQAVAGAAVRDAGVEPPREVAVRDAAVLPRVARVASAQRAAARPFAAPSFLQERLLPLPAPQPAAWSEHAMRKL